MAGAASCAGTSRAGASEAAPFRHPLTPAHIAILRDLAAGMRTPEIARKRGRALRTIHAQDEEAKARIEARTIAHAVVICQRNGWL